MGLDEAVALANAQISESDLYPITKENVDYFINELGYKGIGTYEEMESKLAATGLPIRNFYITNKVMSVFVYYDYPVCVELFYMLEDYSFPGMDMSLGEYIRDVEKRIRKKYDAKDFFGVLHYAHKNAIFMLMNRLYWEVEEKDRFEFFISNYTHYDYGHTVLSKDMVLDVFRCQTSEQRKELLDSLEKIASGVNYVTVYRGQSDKSTNHEDAISWTASKEVAEFFAKRHGFDGEVYVGKVHKDDILAYYTGRGEEEVLIRPKSIRQAQSLNPITITKDIEGMEKEGYMTEYGLYRGTFIQEKYFDNFDGIHGNKHCSRVLLHCLSMSRELGLSDEDRAILSLSACLHDIGRVNDYEDKTHGIRSVDCIGEYEIMVFGINAVNTKREYDILDLDEDADDILYFIIENHCISDTEAKENLNKTGWVADKLARAWRLFEIFKDADGLDRVRLGDLDSDYLRTAAGRNRVLIAYNYLKALVK
ncbi:HD domain-containing protein [Bacillus sp. NEAU-Y102]